MKNIFWENQIEELKLEYIEMLKIIGSLSNLFSDSPSPYLYYRAHENLFCKVFGAKNLSRGDISYDAIKDNVGIGLKTFLNGNGMTFQKVAEFNSESNEIRKLKKDEDIVFKIAEFRNKRLAVTENMTESKWSIYHLITREKGKMNIIEAPMDKIDIASIKIPTKQAKNTIKFKDKENEYSFSLSKNTLLKKFDTRDNNIICQFDVDILKDPFDILKNTSNLYSREVAESQEYIILPLYSIKTQQVEEKSGLNQWNALGRPRNQDEVYIPIPSWIHRDYKNFFVYSRTRKNKIQSGNEFPSFNVELPNGKVLSCRVAQSGGKALMSNPNKALGKWILRDVLNLKPGTLATMKMLEEIGIDSVKLTKENDEYYYLDFMELGSYKDFEDGFKK